MVRRWIYICCDQADARIMVQIVKCFGHCPTTEWRAAKFDPESCMIQRKRGLYVFLQDGIPNEMILTTLARL